MERSVLLVASLLLVAACNDPTMVGGPCVADGTAPMTASDAPRRSTANAYTPRASGAIGSAASNPSDLLSAMNVELSAVTSASLSGHFTQSAIFPGLGSVSPSRGSTFAWLSTGVAGAGTPQTLDTAAAGTQEGSNLSGPGCGAGLSFDCVQLAFAFIVPNNLHSVKFDFRFLSAEYPEYVLSGYNDAFRVSLRSPSHNFANVVFDHQGNPINIDSAFFGESCADLAGTGFDLGTEEYCDAGATGLLSTQAPVEPGEEVEVTFTLYDWGDAIYDTAVMIDNFELSPDEVDGPNTDPTDEPEPDGDCG